MRAAWDECVAPTKRVDDKVAVAVPLAVAALRTYWAAAAADDSQGMLEAMRSLGEAMLLLPDDQFAGVKKLVKRLPLRPTKVSTND
jgi:hypothetical protein